MMAEEQERVRMGWGSWDSSMEDMAVNSLEKYWSPFGKGSIVDVMASKMLIHGCEG
jgi:hypothetical protein